MNLRQIELLRAVVRCETMVKAAQDLGLSQPAVSNAVKHLEQQVGFPLFERINNRLFPTDEARALYDESDPIIALHAALELKVQDFKENRIGHVRLTATPSLGHSLIPPSARRLLKARPKMQLFFNVRHFSAVMDAVDTGAADLGFLLGDGNYTEREAEAFFSMQMVCVMHPQHPLANKQTIIPSDLRGHSFIALEQDIDQSALGKLVRDAFIRADEPFKFLMEVRYSNTACLMAANGIGIAVVDPLTPLVSGNYNLVIRAFEPVCSISAFVIRSRKRPLPRAAAAFLREIQGVASELVQSDDSKMEPASFIL